MITFKLSNRDEKTRVRTGTFRARAGSFSTPHRAVVSTELN